MRTILALLAATALAAAALGTASAETQDRMLKAPQKSLGDEGKLPPTEHMAAPEMGATSPAPADESMGPSGPKGPPKRMGDEGTLPATGNMSGTVPQMNPNPK